MDAIWEVKFERGNGPTMDLGLRGKTVLITGASRGIGAAAAEAFAEEGCNLRLAARDGVLLAALARRLSDTHGVAAHTLTGWARRFSPSAGSSRSAS